MDSFWSFFTEYLRSLPETLGTGKDLILEEVPNPMRRRLSFVLEGSPEQQEQEAMQQLRSLLGDTAPTFMISKASQGSTAGSSM